MHLRDPDERIDAHGRGGRALRRDGVRPRGRRDRLHRARLLLQADPVRVDLSTRPSGASTTSTSTSTRSLEAKRRGMPVKLGLEVDYVGARQDELAASARAVPVGLSARLGALARRARGRPGARTLGGGDGRRGLAALLRGPRRARRPRATSTCLRIPIWPRSSACDPTASSIRSWTASRSRSRRPACASASASCTRTPAMLALAPADHARIGRARAAERRPRLRPRGRARACGRLRDRDRVRRPPRARRSRSDDRACPERDRRRIGAVRVADACVFGG